MNAAPSHVPGERRGCGVPDHGALFFASVWTLFVVVWGFANWPALTTAWWYQDDFHKFGYPWRAIPHVLSLGRPLTVLWELTFLIDANAQRTWQNIALRVFQGGVHCAVGTVVAMVLWRQRRTWGAVLSVLPFLLWPFNAEAVLWRSAGIYPVAALCGVLGMWFIQYPGRRPLRRAAVGACSIVAGMLFNQAAAFSGLVVQLLASALMVVQARIDWRAQCRRLMTTCLAYALGGVVSYAVAHSRAGQRVTFVTDVPGKLGYLWKLNELFLASPHFYPRWLSGVHIGLLVLTVLAVAAAVVSRCPLWSARRAAVSLLILSTAFVTPYAGVLLAAENWPSWRVMYLAPLLMTGVWNELDAALAALKVNAAATLCPLLLIVAGYIAIARVNSGEYVTLFQHDLETLHQIDDYASKEGIRKVYVQPPPHNVYGLRYMHGDSKLSAFGTDWAAQFFIPAFSSLQSSYAEATSAACLAQCADAEVKEDRGLRFYKVQDDAVGCVCWGTAPVPAAGLLRR